ncbi:uncharacterized protein MONOS_2932 [Monocercomonoides exilis]|uniref:uncharacterized protein n=1 Tax=Monocercomonoides exilis TaxID=2049356 RepID=UPI00355A68A4|nr:hypothetical protein MONOS_2932 [Monocercomonoides exilis]|eukprot:MONOS_2932.1-p1 / transcript=MONOS_2932.1 / gene=MONOS_2932 / organism=Monocercomonoides_exilis_PA203 / gene_product=unspecified product / transcript_product=unspecified product / location=Mono_scaffold00064:76209-77807(+) / protein_length=493 / sequence_SO=supercontig / SO=protein_coding / is_pseudo=false
MKKAIPFYQIKEEEEDYEEGDFSGDYYEDEEGEEDYDESDEEEFKSDLTEKFTRSFNELMELTDDKQKNKKIFEMREMMEEMNRKEIESVITKEMFDKIDKMIEEKKLTMESAILLMKHIGYCKVLNGVWNDIFDKSLLSKRIQKIIFKEDKKIGGKKENLLDDLCVCYVMSYEFSMPKKLLVICVPRLLKIALKKEEDEITQKEVEMALMALSYIKDSEWKFEKGQFLHEIEEIVQYHQEHHNLTRLAYQSAWQFLINRFHEDITNKSLIAIKLRHARVGSLEDVIVNELHFVREARRELEELMTCVNWKKKENSNEERKIKAKEEHTLMRWIFKLGSYLEYCQLWNGEYSGLVDSIAHVLRAAQDNFGDISSWCIYSLRNMEENESANVDDLLKIGVVDVFLEEIQLPTLREECVEVYINFFEGICERLREKMKDEKGEEQRKEMKRKIFDKMEEEGYEDCISGLLVFNFNVMLEENILDFEIEDYFVQL